jgi:enoyl-CoA hydratase
VPAREAFDIGLANRLVPKGQSRPEAEKVAAEIARFPQFCMQADRMSAYRQWELPLPQALAEEGGRGMAVVQREGIAGAARFAAGKGRHGAFADI